MKNYIFCEVYFLVNLQIDTHDLAFLQMFGRLFNKSQAKYSKTTTHTHPHTPIRTYRHITTVVTPVFSSIPDTPNSSCCHGQ